MVQMIYYYFLKRSLDDTKVEEPYPSLEYLGDISDYCEIDGVGYIIEDYASEVLFVDNMED